MKPTLSRQLISLKSSGVRAKFPTFAMEAAAKVVGRQAGPSAAARANRTGAGAMSALHYTCVYILFSTIGG